MCHILSNAIHYREIMFCKARWNLIYCMHIRSYMCCMWKHIHFRKHGFHSFQTCYTYYISHQTSQTYPSSNTSQNKHMFAGIAFPSMLTCNCFSICLRKRMVPNIQIAQTFSEECSQKSQRGVGIWQMGSTLAQRNTGILE